jgi:hypothetical protein
MFRVPHRTFVRKRGPGWGYQCADCPAGMPPAFSWDAALAYALQHSQVSSKAVSAVPDYLWALLDARPRKDGSVSDDEDPASPPGAPWCPCAHGEDDLCLNGAIYGPCGDENCGGGCDPDYGTCRSLPGCCDARLPAPAPTCTGCKLGGSLALPRRAWRDRSAMLPR